MKAISAGARVAVVLILLLPVGAGLAAQSARLFDDILQTERITVSDGAYLMAVASGRLPDGASQAEALAFVQDSLPRFSDRVAADELGMAELAYLGMEMFDVSGGLLYTLLRNPRYAYREALYLNLIQGRAAPSRPVSGDRAVRIAQRFLAAYAPARVDPAARREAEQLVTLIRDYELGQVEPVAYRRGQLLYNDAVAKEHRQPTEASQDFARAANELRTVVRSAIAERETTVVTRRSEAQEARADVALRDDFSRADNRLEQAQEYAEQQDYTNALLLLDELSDEYRSLATRSGELRDRALEAIQRVERLLQEIEAMEVDPDEE